MENRIEVKRGLRPPSQLIVDIIILINIIIIVKSVIVIIIVVFKVVSLLSL